MEHKTLVLMFLMFVITGLDTLAYSVRLNAVKSGQFALTTSLYNVIAIVTRMANTFMLPGIGVLIGWSIQQHHDPIWDMRQIVFGATLGSCAFSLLIPWFLRIFGKAVARLETAGSMPALVVQALSLDSIRRIGREATLPSRHILQTLRFREIPKTLLIVNVLVTGIYTVGLLAANYAAILVPETYRLAVSNSSGTINGIATILVTLLIDPKAAVITDQAMRGERAYGDVKALVALLIFTKILGTLFGQLIFVPAAELIAHLYG